METMKQSTQNDGFAAKVFTRVLATLGMVLTLAACGNSSSNNTGGLSGCVNCTSLTNAQPMATYNSESSTLLNPGAYGNSYFPLEMTNMTLYGNGINTVTGFNNGVSGVNSAYGLNVDTYQGAVAVNGTMVIGAQLYDSSGICTIPAGNYTLQTYSQGYMSGGIIQTIQLVANGNIQMTLSGAVIAPSTTGNGYVMSGYLQIVSAPSINGSTAQCGAFGTPMD